MGRKRVIGLTGGIATGKSTVSRLFRELGAPVVDADLIARRVVAKGSEALQELVDLLGPQILKPDGSLDRARLGEIIFADPEIRQKVDEIMHPRVFVQMQEATQKALASARGPVVILDVPLLFESGYTLRLADETLVVYAEPSVQKARLMARNNVDAAEAERRIASQMSLEEKLRRADYVIDNSGSLSETEKQVRRLWEEWNRDADCTHCS